MHKWVSLDQIGSYLDSELEHNQFVFVAHDGEGGTYSDLVFGAYNLPPNTIRFYCVPHDNFEIEL